MLPPLSRYACSDISILVISFNDCSSSVAAVVCNCLLSFLPLAKFRRLVELLVDESSGLISPVVNKVLVESTPHSVSSFLPSFESFPVPLGHFVATSLVEVVPVFKNSLYDCVADGQ